MTTVVDVSHMDFIRPQKSYRECRKTCKQHVKSVYDIHSYIFCYYKVCPTNNVSGK